ncbi:hypothetical protein [Streptomyces sp. NBC_01614]|uniref:Transposase n=1 Tax=Streptomyces sp. NBC_00180 TaxID=2903632 RepID=A0AAU1I043_9ACTN
MGDVTSRTLLHLQCHLGLDTQHDLSLFRRFESFEERDGCFRFPRAGRGFR